jgi:hypothetical protein
MGRRLRLRRIRLRFRLGLWVRLRFGLGLWVWFRLGLGLWVRLWCWLGVWLRVWDNVPSMSEARSIGDDEQGQQDAQRDREGRRPHRLSRADHWITGWLLLICFCVTNTLAVALLGWATSSIYSRAEPSNVRRVSISAK